MNLYYLYFSIAIFVSVGFYLYFLSIKTKKKPHTDALFTEALNLMVKGDSLKAIGILKQVVKQDSDHIRAYLQLGNIIREKNPQQALKIHQSLTVRPNLSPEIRVDIHRALANDYRIIGNNHKSKEEAKLILSIEKRNLWALRFLVEIAEKNKDWDEASLWTKHLTKVSGNKENNDEARFDVFRGIDCLNNGKIDQAKLLFKKAVKNSPEYLLSYRYLGDTYEQNRDLSKALENWESFAEKDMRNGPIVYTKIESALFDLGRYSEVENFYNRILKINPLNLEATIRLANVLDEKGESGQALNLIENIVKTDSFDIRGDLMRLKLSIQISTPIELGYQIDQILDKISKSDES
ncbi:MAG: tetratricopeptide repeat protein [Candidatus Neomarinimicrobiota bacterium]